MKTSKFLTSTCRHCRYYMPEGRRGGFCEQLSVPVQSRWDACSLALPPFTPPWEAIEEIVLWQKQTIALREPLPIDCSDYNTQEYTQPAVAERSTEAVAV
ncbi:MAG: hypothetical protein ACM37W_05355 [Actinomycetota bacterium]